MKNWMGVEYKAVKMVTFRSYYFKSKRLARRWARTQGGDWTVCRIWPGGRVQKIKTYGGHFDDWPEYDHREDY